MICKVCNTPMVKTSLGKTIEYGWYDDQTRDNFQYECENCGKLEQQSILIGVNMMIECQHPKMCETNNNVETCTRCSINKIYPDAWKQ